MLKYYNTLLTFREVPDEITLCINISNCPIHCPDCHSKWLWKDEGYELTPSSIDKLIDANPGITCVAILGGDRDIVYVMDMGRYIKLHHKLKTAWYSGYDRQMVSPNCFDFYKYGPYINSQGGLDNPDSNQVFLKWNGKFWEDQTHLFYNKKGVF